ncbi:MAG: hypothetical protein GDA39_09410 [Hyphomonadaceae bacterium]|nr:hypothetical protein [Hyphomonadaceae bacterium]MBC6413056.1 hypothetical protein [Hyphomonadaceae bacterium]
MIKTTLITLCSAGLLGTGVHILTPQSMKIIVGPMVLEIDSEGLTKSRADVPDFVIIVAGRDNGEFKLRL